MFSWLFGKKSPAIVVAAPPEPPKRQVVCPTCMRSSPVAAGESKCEHCGDTMEPLYLRYYDKAPPMFVQLVGWEQAGKSYLLAGIDEVLRNAGRIWRNAGAEFVDIRGKAQVDKRNRSDGGMIDSNKPTSEIESAAFLDVPPEIRWVRGIPLYGDRLIVTRECAGEDFRTFRWNPVIQGYMQRVKTALFVIDETVQIPNHSMIDLYSSYKAGLTRLGVPYDAGDRSIIVVLSKADSEQLSLSKSLREYVKEDPVRSLLESNGALQWEDDQLEAYLDRMRHVSREVKEWMRTRPGGADFLNNANAEKIKVHACVVSGYGFDPLEHPEWRPAPKRVIDPLIWCLECNSRVRETQAAS